jgi:hypothetical protein
MAIVAGSIADRMNWMQEHIQGIVSAIEIDPSENGLRIQIA